MNKQEPSEGACDGLSTSYHISAALSAFIDFSGKWIHPNLFSMDCTAKGPAAVFCRPKTVRMHRAWREYQILRVKALAMYAPAQRDVQIALINAHRDLKKEDPDCVSELDLLPMKRNGAQVVHHNWHDAAFMFLERTGDDLQCWEFNHQTNPVPTFELAGLLHKWTYAEQAFLVPPIHDSADNGSSAAKDAETPAMDSIPQIDTDCDNSQREQDTPSDPINTEAKIEDHPFYDKRRQDALESKNAGIGWPTVKKEHGIGVGTIKTYATKTGQDSMLKKGEPGRPTRHQSSD